MATWSGLWGSSYSPIKQTDPIERGFFYLGRKVRKTRALLDTLIGQAAGQTATLSVKRVQANTSEQGGKRIVENRSIVNRATTAADRTYMRDMFSEDSKIATPTSKSGRWGA